MLIRYLKILPISILLLISIGKSATGDWHSITHMDKINCLQTYHGYVYVGTSGGIRRHQPKTFKEKIYNNPYDGFLDIDVVAMAVSEKDELWAATKNGYLYKLDKSGKWITLDRGFNKLGWKFNNKAMISSGSYIILGSNKGLSFINISRPGEEYVEINLTKFGDAYNLSITALFKHDSVLYIGTSAGLYEAVIYWDDIVNPPASFSRIHKENIFNPQLWVKSGIKNTSNPDSSQTVGHIRFYQGEIQTFSAGHTIYEPFFCSAVPGQPLQIENKFYNSITNMESVGKIKNSVFLGSSRGFYTLQSDTARQYWNSTTLNKGIIADVYSHSSGLYTWTMIEDEEGNLGLFHTYIMKYEDYWRPIEYIIMQGIEPTARHMQTMSVFGPNRFFVGTWGFGIHARNNDEKKTLTASNSCLATYDPNSAEFVVVSSTVAAPDGGIFASLIHAGKPFTLIHADFDTSIIPGYDSLRAWCFSPAIFPDQKAAYAYQMKLYNDDILLVSTNMGVHAYRIINPKAPSGLKFIKQTTSSNENTDIFGAEIDDYGRLWATGAAGFFYLDNFLDSSQTELIPVDEITENDCHIFEKDGRGNIWAGCKTGLLHIEPGRKTLVDKISRYKNRDGMLDDEVINLHVDNSNGQIWIVTPKGINMLESGIGRKQSSSAQVKVYPNPFKPDEDNHISFSNLPESPEVYIFNESGTLVFQSTDSDIKYGEIFWSGENNRGEKVSPGIYFYTVKSGKFISRGKIILAR